MRERGRERGRERERFIYLLSFYVFAYGVYISYICGLFTSLVLFTFSYNNIGMILYQLCGVFVGHLLNRVHC